MKIAGFEEHGEVLAHWASSGWQRETLICFDRHFDFKKLKRLHSRQIRSAFDQGKSLAPLNRDAAFRCDSHFAYGLDDFLYPAMELGLIDRLIWVYPSPLALSDRSLVELLWKQFERIPGVGDDVLKSVALTACGPQVKLFNRFEILLTTVDRLNRVALNNHARLDIDLDFFFLPEHGLSHDVDDVATHLKKLRFDADSVAFTYSVSSGFLPDSLRWIGNSLATAFRGELEIIGSRPQKTAHVMQALQSNSAMNDDEIGAILEKEALESGAYWSARSVLTLKNKDSKSATDCYFRAVESGDRAIWPAYSLGFHYMEQKSYHAALQWFQRAYDQEEPADALELHSLFLAAVCALRVNEHHLAYTLSTQCIDLTPLRIEAYSIAILAAKKLSLAEAALGIEQKLKAVKATYEGLAQEATT